MSSHEELPSNFSDNEHFQTIVKRAVENPQRRAMMKSGLGLAALGFLGLEGCGGGDGAVASTQGGTVRTLSFASTPLNQTFDGVSVAQGYQFEVLYKLGDPINDTLAAYKNDGTDGTIDPTEFDFRAGDHHDGMYFFGLTADGKWDETVSDRGLLCINHEAITPLFLHPNGASATPRPVVEIDKEHRIHGVSIVEIKKVNGKFQVVRDSVFNRRITTLTPMIMSGPLSGNDALKTKFSPDGTRTRGTLNNCASGYTPWGTYLTCEENWAGYFRRDAADVPNRSANERASELRYGVTSTSGREGWSVGQTDDEYLRWNITRTGADATADYRNAANTYGYNVEIDPFKPASTPRKRTAMGRFAHEGAWVGPVEAGKPVVFYMGCDSRNEYIYKFVSAASWDPRDINGGLAVGDKYLNSGKLYVAKFKPDFSGEWIELTVAQTGTQAIGGETFTFSGVNDTYLNTRIVADKVGGTPMDRPEWGAVNPKNGEVYMTLTNNSQRRLAAAPNATNPNSSILAPDAANPRTYRDNAGTGNPGNINGHIIRWKESGSNPAALAFAWDIYVFGAESDDLNNPNVNLSGLTAANLLSSPDGLWFSEKTGILYIQTDDGAFVNETAGNGSTCMLLAAIPGTVGDGQVVTVKNDNLAGGTLDVTTKVGKTGELRRLLTGPIDCEITGIHETHDGKVLFVNIQHPGEDTTSANLASPRSSWPYPLAGGGFGNPAAPTTAKTARPRSATIVITRTDGGVIGGELS